MTQTELLNTIRREIERQSKSIEDATGDFAEGRRLEQRIILSFLDTLEEPEVDGLEEEARKYLTNNFTPPGDKESFLIEDAAYTLWFDDVCHLARHFAEWGAKNAK